jgi:hypothetical protein
LRHVAPGYNKIIETQNFTNHVAAQMVYTADSQYKELFGSHILDYYPSYLTLDDPLVEDRLRAVCHGRSMDKKYSALLKDAVNLVLGSISYSPLSSDEVKRRISVLNGSLSYAGPSYGSLNKQQAIGDIRTAAIKLADKIIHNNHIATPRYAVFIKPDVVPANKFRLVFPCDGAEWALTKVIFKDFLENADIPHSALKINHLYGLSYGKVTSEEGESVYHPFRYGDARRYDVDMPVELFDAACHVAVSTAFPIDMRTPQANRLLVEGNIVYSRSEALSANHRLLSGKTGTSAIGEIANLIMMAAFMIENNLDYYNEVFDSFSDDFFSKNGVWADNLPEFAKRVFGMQYDIVPHDDIKASFLGRKALVVDDHVYMVRTFDRAVTKFMYSKHAIFSPKHKVKVLQFLREWKIYKRLGAFEYDVMFDSFVRYLRFKFPVYADDFEVLLGE